MRLYHGSNVVIESINLAMCRPYKDFGKGFYLTDIEEQAKQSLVVSVTFVILSAFAEIFSVAK